MYCGLYFDLFLFPTFPVLYMCSVKTEMHVVKLNAYDNKNEGPKSFLLKSWRRDFDASLSPHLFQNTQLHMFPWCPEQVHRFIVFPVRQHNSINLRNEEKKEWMCAVCGLVCLFVWLFFKWVATLPPGSCRLPAVFHPSLPLHLVLFWTQICRCHSQHKAGPHLQLCWSPSLRKTNKNTHNKN